MGHGSSEEDDLSSDSWSRSPSADRANNNKKRKRSKRPKSGGGGRRKKSRKDQRPARWTSEDTDTSGSSGGEEEERGRSARRGRRRFSPSPIRGPTSGAGSRRISGHGLTVTDDAREDKMRLRKRAMVLGKFRFIVPEDGVEFEATSAFRSTVARHCSGGHNRSVHYSFKPIGFRKVPRAQHSNTRYAILKADFPGIGDRFHVAWATPLGDVHVDGMVKLYDLRSIQMHCIDYDSRGPKSGWFGLVDPRIADTPDSKVHFDANMFWTVGLLYKHYGTCGVEDWDIEMAEMANTHVVAENTSRLPQALGQSVVVQAAPPPPGVPAASLPPPLMSVQPTLSSVSAAPSLTATASAAASSSVVTNLNTFGSSVRTTTETTTTTSNRVEGTLFTGCVVDWRGTYGFVTCNHIPRKVFLHSSVIEGWDSGSEKPLDLPVGSSVKFRVEYDVFKGYRASEAELFV